MEPSIPAKSATTAILPTVTAAQTSVSLKNVEMVLSITKDRSNVMMEMLSLMMVAPTARRIAVMVSCKELKNATMVTLSVVMVALIHAPKKRNNSSRLRSVLALASVVLPSSVWSLVQLLLPQVPLLHL